MREENKESLRAGLAMEYGKFVKYAYLGSKNRSVSEKRAIEGSFTEVGSEKVHSGDNFMAWDVAGDAMLSYQAACAYFNHTRRSHEKERVAFSAKWSENQ